MIKTTVKHSQDLLSYDEKVNDHSWACSTCWDKYTMLFLLTYHIGITNDVIWSWKQAVFERMKNWMCISCFFSRYVWLFSTRILSSHSSMSGIHLLKVFIVEDHLQSQLHKVSPEELLLLQETLKLGISKLGAKLQMYNQDSSPCHKLTNASLCVLQSFTSSLFLRSLIFQ